MPKIARKLMQIFGNTATTNQRSVFGSLAAAAPAFSTDVETIQSLGNWQSGWYAAIVAGANPAIEDMNSMAYVFAYQLAYGFQAGIPEWNAQTTYYIGSVVNDGSGTPYVSLIDSNLNNPISDVTKWRKGTGLNVTRFIGNGSWVCPAGVTSARIRVYQQPVYTLHSPTTSSVIWLDQSGNGWGTGQNPVGQLANGGNAQISSPTLVVGGFKFSRIITAGSNTNTYALTADGKMYAWGQNTGAAPIGVGDNIARSSPTLIPFPTNTIVNLGGTIYPGGPIYGSDGDAASSSMMILDTQGRAYGWGNNSDGDLGVGDVVTRSSPTLVIGGKKFARAWCTRGSDSFKLALGTDGNLYSWGVNTNGCLGVGDVTSRSSPTLVVGNPGIVDLSVDASDNFIVYGFTADRTTYAWGNNPSATGLLGVGDLVTRSSPTLIAGGYKFQWVMRPISGVHCGIDLNNKLYIWGSNTTGQLGLGDVTSRSSPTLVSSTLRFVQVLGVMGNAILALTDTGDVYSWGGNALGQLGTGDTTPRSTPTLVLSGKNVTTLSGAPRAGAQRVYTVCADGTSYVWGENSDGQLGVGDTVARSTPTLVSLLPEKVTTVFGCTGSRAIWLGLSGALYAVGRNDVGQGGNGDALPRSSPTLVLAPGAMNNAVTTVQVSVPVTPGLTYPLVFGLYSQFGSTPLGSVGTVPQLIEIEY